MLYRYSCIIQNVGNFWSLLFPCCHTSRRKKKTMWFPAIDAVIFQQRSFMKTWWQFVCCCIFKLTNWGKKKNVSTQNILWWNSKSVTIFNSSDYFCWREEFRLNGPPILLFHFYTCIDKTSVVMSYSDTSYIILRIVSFVTLLPKR